MRPAEDVGHEYRPSEPETPRLEDLVPIAVVIAAGCEPCAEKMVQRALRRGSAAPLIERTLGIVAHIRSRDCFAQAVGPVVVARMERPLEAGKKALRGSGGSAPGCCG